MKFILFIIFIFCPDEFYLYLLGFFKCLLELAIAVIIYFFKFSHDYA